MRMIADAIEHGLAQANYHADLASKRRSLSAWGTVERKGKAWSWTWTGVGIPAKYLPAPMECVSDDAAWLALEATVLVITRDIRKVTAGKDTGGADRRGPKIQQPMLGQQPNCMP